MLYDLYTQDQEKAEQIGDITGKAYFVDMRTRKQRDIFQVNDLSVEQLKVILPHGLLIGATLNRAESDEKVWPGKEQTLKELLSVG